MRIFVRLFLLMLIPTIGFGQWEQRKIITNDNITYPETSKWSRISNTIGITEVEVIYHRPAVRNRVLFGSLIPYGKVWRAGANESTTIRFQDSVSINGHPLAPGIYGIHMIPDEKNWTIIFSNNHTQWGSFYYDQTEDALRIEVEPIVAPHQEYLKYDVEDIQDNSMNITLHWAKTKVAFKVEVDEIATTLAVIRDELRTLPRFNWKGNREAALFCWLHDTNLTEALEWINQAVRQEERFETLYLKALILQSLERKSDFEKIMEKVREIGNENQFLYIAFEALGHHNSPQKSIMLFENTLKYFPASYEAILYKGNVLAMLGQDEEARKAFKTALSLAKDEKAKAKVLSIKKRFDL